ncbi:DUF3334 family protein [Parashewanella spongiae]|uniref:DUF3334 family protein n=1 Tax=Parashewanella spongiae TaxID=342950 RepID=A0A3A6TQX7_9GAMM|nr:DUF3334 family protein [Parashewanella spongiae]MCL1079549.1 DUF3334 family protein [Parashewanella spongiae]RJY07377.1 DUF3334 family protein [Parashewanella spongiae]
MVSNKIIKSDDILLKLCHSVSHILTTTTDSSISHAGMIQSISRTRLKPDIGCFSIFDGGFSGLVIMNFSSDAAMDIYRRYMLNMGIQESDLAISFTSDEVSNVLGELMNQILGYFINKVSKELQTSIKQSQPKMLTVNRELSISVDANLDAPQARRVSFTTEDNHNFYLEFAMDKTEFIQLDEFEFDEDFDPDSLIEIHGIDLPRKHQSAPKANPAVDSADDLLDELGL